MKARIIFLVGAIGLTACTTMNHPRSGDWRDNGSPSYRDGKSRSHSSSADIRTSDIVEQHKPRTQPHDPASRDRRRLLDKLESNVQKSLTKENLPINILGAYGTDKAGNRILVQRNGSIIDEHDLEIPNCGANEDELQTYKEPFDRGPCFCQFTDPWEGEYPHMHCNFTFRE